MDALRDFDQANYLTDAESIAGYLCAALQGVTDILVAALDDVARALKA